MKFADKLVILRKKAGCSQEQLAGLLGVSRQSVSKWEADAAMPELSKLITISDIFHVSVDCLVRRERELEEETGKDGAGNQAKEASREEIGRKLDELTQMIQGPRGYCYVSSRRINGIPLVHIHVNPGSWIRIGGRSMGQPGVAKGIIAIGDFSVGVISFGCISAGIFSLGVLSVGCISLGVVSLGLLSGGITSMGLLSAGISSIGILGSWGIAELKLGK